MMQMLKLLKTIKNDVIHMLTGKLDNMKEQMWSVSRGKKSKTEAKGNMWLGEETS